MCKRACKRNNCKSPDHGDHSTPPRTSLRSGTTAYNEGDEGIACDESLQADITDEKMFNIVIFQIQVQN